MVALETCPVRTVWIVEVGKICIIADTDIGLVSDGVVGSHVDTKSSVQPTCTDSR